MEQRLSKEQRLRIVELFVIGMYLSGRIGSPEDRSIKQWITTGDFESDYERDVAMDDLFTSASSAAPSEASWEGKVEASLEAFPSTEERRMVFDSLRDFLSDSDAPKVKGFLDGIKSMFGL